MYYWTIVQFFLQIIVKIVLTVTKLECETDQWGNQSSTILCEIYLYFIMNTGGFLKVTSINEPEKL